MELFKFFPYTSLHSHISDFITVYITVSHYFYSTMPVNYFFMLYKINHEYLLLFSKLKFSVSA